MALGSPTAIVETSAGNFQWSYRLSPAVPKAALIEIEGILVLTTR
jgi:hypothetical protein